MYFKKKYKHKYLYNSVVFCSYYMYVKIVARVKGIHVVYGRRIAELLLV